MEFPTSLSRKPINKIQSEIFTRMVVLNTDSIKTFIEIVEHKRRDLEKIPIKSVKEDRLFLIFIKQSLTKKDPRADEILDIIYSNTIEDTLNCNEPTLPEVSKYFAKNQLQNLKEEAKIPENIEKILDKEIKAHIELDSGVLSETLINFIENKIPAILSYLTNASLQDYITLTFLSMNFIEKANSSFKDIEKQIKRGRPENEVSNKIINSINSELMSLNTPYEKLKYLQSFYTDIENSWKECEGNNSEKHTRTLLKRINVVLGDINSRIIGIIQNKISKIKPESFSSAITLELKKQAVINAEREADIKRIIIEQQMRIIKSLDEKIKKLQTLEEEMKLKAHDEVEIEKTEAIKKVIEFYTNTTKHHDEVERKKEAIKKVIEFYTNTTKQNEEIERLYEEIEKHSQKSNKCLLGVEKSNQELNKLHEIYVKKAEKLKVMYNSTGAIKDLLSSNYSDKEYELFLKEREISTEFRAVQLETAEIINACQKVQEEKERYKNTQMGFIESLFFNATFLALGVALKYFIS
ncbi:hypothetical protein SteCoe_25059 [Stentor coeruleus]|uniref:Uncharacterized protein n=1 Tax=Stentor coeruleus TaxID=5963 RepID=A0A1R2BG23_9CILI|nr:hypothetical protein SteCoe_25059 [Stentor coeruleus]